MRYSTVFSVKRMRKVEETELFLSIENRDHFCSDVTKAVSVGPLDDARVVTLPSATMGCPEI